MWNSIPQVKEWPDRPSDQTKHHGADQLLVLLAQLVGPTLRLLADAGDRAVQPPR